MITPDETPPFDVVDDVVDQLMVTSGWAVLQPVLSASIAAIVASDTSEQLDANLLATLPTLDGRRMTEAFERASFTLRIGAEAGADIDQLAPTENSR